MAVDGDLPALVVHNGAGAVVVILDHAEARHMLQRCAAQGLPDPADLSSAAVDEQQVGQRRKLILRAVRLLAAAICRPPESDRDSSIPYFSCR